MLPRTVSISLATSDLSDLFRINKLPEGQAIGGYQRGASQARAGVDQNYQLELGAKKQIYVSQVDAAGHIRNAGLEAAKLRQAAAVIAAVGRETSREVGHPITILSPAPHDALKEIDYTIAEICFAKPQV